MAKFSFCSKKSFEALVKTLKSHALPSASSHNYGKKRQDQFHDQETKKEIAITNSVTENKILQTDNNIQVVSSHLHEHLVHRLGTRTRCTDQKEEPETWQAACLILSDGAVRGTSGSTRIKLPKRNGAPSSGHLCENFTLTFAETDEPFQKMAGV